MRPATHRRWSVQAVSLPPPDILHRSHVRRRCYASEWRPTAVHGRLRTCFTGCLDCIEIAVVGIHLHRPRGSSVRIGTIALASTRNSDGESKPRLKPKRTPIGFGPQSDTTGFAAVPPTTQRRLLETLGRSRLPASRKSEKNGAASSSCGHGTTTIGLPRSARLASLPRTPPSERRC